MKRVVGVAAWAVVAAGCAGKPATAPRGSAPTPAASRDEIAPNPGLHPEATCLTTAPEVCFDAIDNNCNGQLEEGCGVLPGIVQVAAAWDELAADVDLVVTDPSGEVARPNAPTTAGLFKERDCPGPDQNCKGKLLENVYLEGSRPAPPGKYRVRLRLEKTGGARLPLRINVGARFGAKNYGFSFYLAHQGEEKTFLFFM